MSESNKYEYQFVIEEADVEKGETSHAKLLQMVLPGSTVLECGPSYGIMTRYLKEKLGCKVYILEVDSDCYDSAIQYADGGICTDIEDDKWLSQFDEMSFDYILYADVLEHLRNPQLVLTKMRQLLKPDGEVLLSVPNVANGDIIMNLLCDRFHYTPLGLLDNTHIHLFAREDLHVMIQEAGYYLAYESCTLSPTFSNEQGAFLSQEERLRLGWVLAEHSTRNIYQFICRLVTKETETQSDIGFSDNIAVSSQVRLFLDISNEFTKVLASANSREQMLRDEMENLKITYEGQLQQQRNNLEQQLTRQHEELKQQLLQVQGAYNAISNAFFWKITKPARSAVIVLKSLLKKNRYICLLYRGLKCWKQNGFSYTWKRFKDKLHNRQNNSSDLFTREELERQRKTVFPQKIKFSILVPLYNTPEKFLREMIRSVVEQTYGDWELCLADGSDKNYGAVEDICRQYTNKDFRIKYEKLKENLGISENTNACISMATGDYIGLLDHDDLLHPAALFEVMKAICEQNADFIYTDENTFHEKPEDAYCPHYKPDFAPDTLRSYNYICHFTVFRHSLLERSGEVFRSRFDGSQDYDLILRLTEKADHIVHIPKILYYWRSHETSVASDVAAKPYTMRAAKMALAEHLERVGLRGKVLDARIPSTYQIQYEIDSMPLVSILIPNKDHVEDLKRCLDSIREKTTYSNWEVIVIENNSVECQTFAYYDEIINDKRIRVVHWEGKFNYSAINNFGADYVNGEYLLLLNNDTEIITPDWIEQMLMFAQRKDVGAVGCMLYYPDNTVQHAGVILGIGGVAGHAHKYFRRGDYGYMSRLTITQNFSAVTAACIMIRRDVWDEVSGMDEKFEVAFNDVDFCMRIRAKGYLIVWTPYAELYHYESKSRGYEDTPEKQRRFSNEALRFQRYWREKLEEGDPYYNPNLSLEREDFSLK